MQLQKQITGFNDRWLILGLLSALLVSVPLFTKEFTVDWINHTWAMNYNARYFAHHLSFPSVINTHQIIGLPNPIFYGYLFFPIMGLCSLFLDAEMTVRLFATGLFALEFVLAYTTLVKFTRNQYFSFTVGTILIWAIYPLTNLFHRAALPEFFATGLLTCACISWVRAFSSETRNSMRTWCMFSVLFLCAAAGTHPITALYGIVFYIVLFLLSWLLRPNHKFRDVVFALLVPAIISALVLYPWVQTTGKYNRKMHIAQSFHVIGFYRLTIDNLPLRMSPIPIPYQYLAKDAAIENMTTPHLDAQINIPMLIAFLAVFFTCWRKRRIDLRTTIALSVLLFVAALFTYFSVTNGFNRAGFIARSIQFFYRMVTYINLSLFCGILLAAAQTYLSRYQRNNFSGASAGIAPTNQPQSVGQTPSGSSINGSDVPANSGISGGVPSEPADRSSTDFVSRKYLIAALAISTIALAFKLSFTTELEPIGNHFFASQRSDEELLNTPKVFYGTVDYTIPSLVADVPEKAKVVPVMLDPLPGANFGDVGTHYVPAGTKWSLTNVQEFDWNRLAINGQPQVQDRLFAKDLDLAIQNAGATNLGYAFVPSPGWVQMHHFSIYLFLTWLIACILYAVVSLSRKKNKQALSETDLPIAQDAATSKI